MVEFQAGSASFGGSYRTRVCYLYYSDSNRSSRTHWKHWGIRKAPGTLGPVLAWFLLSTGSQTRLYSAVTEIGAYMGVLEAQSLAFFQEGRWELPGGVMATHRRCR